MRLPNLKSRFLPNIPENEISKALTEFRGAFRDVGLFTAAINILLLAPSLYMMQVYDRVLGSRNSTTLIMLSLMIVGFFVLINTLDYLRGVVVTQIGVKLDSFLNERIFTASFEQNLKLKGVNAGQALNDLTTIRQFVTGNAIFVLFDAPWFPVYLLIIFVFNFWLGVFALVSTVTLISLAWINERLTKQALAEANNLSIESTNTANNHLRNAEVIHALGMLPNLRSRWYKLHQKFLKAQLVASQRGAVIGSVTKCVRASVQSLILGLAAYLVIIGDVSSGMMIGATLLLGRAIGPVEQVISVWRQWRGVLSSYARLTQLLADNPQRPDGMALPAPIGELRVSTLIAAPPGRDTPILRGLSFDAHPGEVIGIMGPSGAGKSTLARLLVGVWPAASGSVRLDAADVYQWNKTELGPHIGYLPQDIELFAGSISENIARFTEVDPEKVVEAAKVTGFHEMILQFPRGYDTVIGDAGAGLSGGQKQRIGLARALYGDPSFIVLDEPNSNLDEAGVASLMKAVSVLSQQKKTVILITHNPLVLRVTSKLMILRNGLIDKFGPTGDVVKELTEASRAANPQVPTVSGGAS